MQALHFPLQLRQTVGGGLDDKQVLAGGFELALPSVKGFDGAANDVDAGGEALLDHGARNLPSENKIRAGDQYNPRVFCFCAIHFHRFVQHIITAFSAWRERLK